MPNLFDYVAWRGDLSFDLFPFNPVDNIVFSQLSYLPMGGVVPEPGKEEPVSVAAAAKLYAAKRKTGRVASKDFMAAKAGSVISAIGTAARYEDCRLFGYVKNTEPGEEKQFSAFCALIGTKPSSRKLVVVYRGTDTSLVGWKEDLNMAFVDSVPSQKQAVSYLEEAAGRFSYPIIVAGHSKGGNLAVYASAFCNGSVQRRISAVYSNDAPGFRGHVIQSDGYKAVCPRINAFVPQSSFFGMLFEHAEPPTVAKSSAIGLSQHDVCSWEVERDGLVPGGELTAQSRLANRIIREWVGKFGEEQRHRFVEAVYKILVSTNADTLIELGADWPNTAAGIISGLKNIDGPTKKLMGEIVGELFRTASKNIMRMRKSDRSGKLWDTDLFGEGG